MVTLDPIPFVRGTNNRNTLADEERFATSAIRIFSSKFWALLSSPLLHFTVLGCLIFLVYSQIDRAAAPYEQHNILHLGDAQALKLVDDFVAARHRYPTVEEYRELVNGWAETEALVREALALGLDQDDAIIRNRLRSKMEFIAEAPAAAMTPDDRELGTYYEEEARRYATPSEISFEQILLPEGADALDVELLKAKLEAGADPQIAGKLAMLPAQLNNVSVPTVAWVFGKEFGSAVSSMPLGQWSGPVSSGFGAHLVRLDARREAVLPPLDDVRDRVLAEWRLDQAHKLREAFSRKLLGRYTVDAPLSVAEVKP